jgi:hypothetical protein
MAAGLPARLRPHATSGVWLSWIGDEAEDGIRAAFGSVHAKLAATKAAYDPDNVFRCNRNVQPAASLAGQ